jgi:hypothetical protein
VGFLLTEGGGLLLNEQLPGTPGVRQLVREAVAAFFGGSTVAADQGIAYQGGPLSAMGLGTTFPYLIKGGAPDNYYTLGEPDGTSWGAVLTVHLGRVTNTRDSYGGATSGWRKRLYEVRCALDVISYAPHLEGAEAPLDDLVNAMDALIYADRTLGTTGQNYPGGRLIIEAGEGRNGISHGEAEWTTEADRGRGRGGIDYTFDVLTMVSA